MEYKKTDLREDYKKNPNELREHLPEWFKVIAELYIKRNKYYDE